jgi:uncharacterized protein (TIGR00661 family)
MTRILYGVSGEGSGHSSRAREVLTHLLQAGHEVLVASYDQGYRNLAGDFEVFQTEGLRIVTTDNKVSPVRTFASNLGRLSDGVRKLRELRAVCFREFDPHVVITDFEPMTAYSARHFKRPLVSLDNQHRMRYMRHPVPAELRRDALVTEAVIKAMVPRPDVALVTTFYFGEVRNERTFLFPPILRRLVRDMQPADEGHILVYFTHAFDSYLDVLRALPRERFLVYGYDRDEEEGNLAFRRKSVTGFMRDLAAAKAVVATAGFTLMTESLHLGKPYFALPMEGQFEQQLNALLLEQLGYGENGRGRLGRDALAAFLYGLPEYRDALAEYPRTNGDDALFAKLDELVADDGAEALRWRRLRRGE